MNGREFENGGTSEKDSQGETRKMKMTHCKLRI
jgi:hypothetical protein